MTADLLQKLAGMCFELFMHAKNWCTNLFKDHQKFFSFGLQIKTALFHFKASYLCWMMLQMMDVAKHQTHGEEAKKQTASTQPTTCLYATSIMKTFCCGPTVTDCGTAVMKTTVRLCDTVTVT
jgi:hypothetical protein